MVKHVILVALAAVLAPAVVLAQPPSGGSPFYQNAFNPDISLIIDFDYANVNVSNEAAAALGVAGFTEHVHRDGKERGINFNYLELSFAADVDPWFDLFAVIAAEAEGVEVEEAYVNTRSLPWGCGLRLGRFLSSFGRFNQMHQHYWDFLDAPLAHEMLTGGHGLGNPGLRLSWTAPLDVFLQVQGEVFQGTFDDNPTFNATGVAPEGDDDPIRLVAPDAATPALFAGTVKTSFDSGPHVVLLGVSGMRGPSSHQDAEHAVVADGTLLYGADLTYKYLIDSYRSVAVTAEFLRRRLDGEIGLAGDPASHGIEKTHSGLHTQAVWRFDRHGRWRVGARYDLLTENSITIDGAAESGLETMLPRYTGMLEFSPTEFSRLRLQYNHDRSRYSGEVRRDVREIFLQLTFAVGPHGAHTF